jgi:hypothetical protein
MTKSVRAALVLTGVLSVIPMAGFMLNLPWASDLWLWPDSPLSYLFIASILAAIAAPVVWIGLSGELGAMAPGALDLTLTYSGIAAFLLVHSGNAGQGYLLAYAVGSGLAAVGNFGIFLWSRGQAPRDTRPLPMPVRVAFAVFALLLIGVGTALLLGTAHVFPWPLKPESSVVFGWVYLGAAVYFLYGLKKSTWGYGYGQLVGFLAYDLVLLWPFLQRFELVKPEHLLSLTVYTIVIISSGLLALFYLVINKDTRLWHPG